MAKISLKSIIEKDGMNSILNAFIETAAAVVCIKDISGKILLGTEAGNSKVTCPIFANDEQIGSVSGDEESISIANLLNYLSQKEADKDLSQG